MTRWRWVVVTLIASTVAVVIFALTASDKLWDRVSDIGALLAALATVAAAVAAWRAAGDSAVVARESRQALKEARLGLALRVRADIFFQLAPWVVDPIVDSRAPWVVRLLGPVSGRVTDVEVRWNRAGQPDFVAQRESWEMGEGLANPVEFEVAPPGTPLAEVSRWTTGGSITWTDIGFGARWSNEYTVTPMAEAQGGIRVDVEPKLISLPLG